MTYKFILDVVIVLVVITGIADAITISVLLTTVGKSYTVILQEVSIS